MCCLLHSGSFGVPRGSSRFISGTPGGSSDSFAFFWARPEVIDPSGISRPQVVGFIRVLIPGGCPWRPASHCVHSRALRVSSFGFQFFLSVVAQPEVHARVPRGVVGLIFARLRHSGARRVRARAKAWAIAIYRTSASPRDRSRRGLETYRHKTGNNKYSFAE